MAVQANLQHKVILKLGDGVRILFPPPVPYTTNRYDNEYYQLEFHGMQGERVPMNYQALYSLRNIWQHIRQVARGWGGIRFEHVVYSYFNPETLLAETINVKVEEGNLYLTHRIRDHSSDDVYPTVESTIEFANKPYSSFRELERIMPRLMKEIFRSYKLEDEEVSSDSDELESVTGILQRNRIVLRNRRRYIRRLHMEAPILDDSSSSEDELARFGRG